ncbi:MAG: alanyl-tRNA editing protein [Agathobacter sp.]
MSENKETLRLYDADAYAVEFDATVVSCETVTKNEKNVYQVILDQTLFFPEEGGQSPDMGTIDGVEVVDVQIKKNIITHTLTKPLSVGQKVHGKIDWTHRFYNMQQHSAEHIFSGLVHSRFGYNNVGFHLSDQIVTMDFDGVLTPEEISDIEYAVNEAITKNIEVKVSFPSKEELAKIEYRSKIEIEGQVRIVEIPGYDICACCAPHVRRTGEIGMLKVMSVQNYKGGVRISVLSGFRALLAFREKAQIITELMNLLTCGQENLVENISKQKTVNQSLKSQLVNAKQALMEYKLKELPKDLKQVLLFEKDLDSNGARNAVNKLVENYDGLCGVFCGDDAGGYSYVIGSKTMDCKEIANLLREKLSARGGGSPAMIQGSVTATEEQIKNVLEFL